MTDPTARALRLLSLLQTYKFWSGDELAARARGQPADAAPRRRPAARAGLSRRRDTRRHRRVPARGRRAPPSPAARRRRSGRDRGRPARRGRRVDRGHRGNVGARARQARAGPARSVAPPGERGAHQRVVDAVGRRHRDRRRRRARRCSRSACRDNEQVRFDYRRRDGDEAQRLVEPHNLVSAGRRWYLVGWDVRREDWRTFRLDRLDAPRLGGVRFRPRELPAENAAAFVAASIAAMPVPFEATIVVTGPGRGGARP